MSPLGPRRPRFPGQRSFGPAGMGSPRDWHKVIHSPEVQRMLQDPQLAQALYQNYRMTGGQLPPDLPGGLPVGMQDGGGVPTPEEINQLAQIRSGDVDPETGNELQELAQQSRPLRPVRRFADGGQQQESMTELQNDRQQAMAELAKATQSNDPKAIQAANQKILRINNQIASAGQAQAQPSTAPVSFGSNIGQVSGSTMQNMQKLGQQGPPTLGNTAMAAGMGALMGGGGTGRGVGALIGGATAGLLSYFIRKNAQQKKKQQDGSGGGGSDYYQGSSQEPSGQPSAGGGTTAGGGGGIGSQSTPPPPPNAQGLWYGTSSAGNVKSYDQGKTWLKDNEKPFNPTANDPVINQTQVTTDVAPAATTPATPTTQLPDSDMTEGMGLAEGGPVPSHGLGLHHMPIPVLHTTIVITAKPKKGKGQSEEKPVEKKAMGGEIPQAARRARKPNAIPPVAGPNASGARLPRGRVQVPKGSGAAIKGKRFGGVF